MPKVLQKDIQYTEEHLQNLKNMYGRDSSASKKTRESSALLHRNPSSASRRYLKPVDILREVRNSNEALEANLQAVPYSKVQQYRAVSNHRNDVLSNQRAYLASRHEKSIQAHINRARNHNGGHVSERSALENYNGLSEGVVEVSPEYNQYRRGGPPVSNRQSVQLKKISDNAVEYDGQPKYRPSQAAL